MLLSISRGYVLAGAAVAAGLYALPDPGEDTPPVPPRVAPVEPIRVTAARPMPTLVMPSIEPDTVDTEHEVDDELEEVRGHAPFTDATEFAMVFELDGTVYLRLSNELRATARGRARLIVRDEVHAVVASVAASALPDGLEKWRDRTVLVNGTCSTRVIGFAEVSRISGDPPGSEDYWYGPEEDRPAQEPTWTIDSIVADNVTLVAKLADGCSGSWARSTEHESAQIAQAIEEPALETEAIADLLARGDVDPIQDEWKEMGGEGEWRDSVEVAAKTYVHPATGETWIFVGAYQAGGCGEASVSKMAAYRVGASGTVNRFTDLEFAGETIQDVVDLDGDGQPELVLGGGGDTQLVDLANTHHDSISVPFHHYGCGC